MVQSALTPQAKKFQIQNPKLELSWRDDFIYLVLTLGKPSVAWPKSSSGASQRSNELILQEEDFSTGGPDMQELEGAYWEGMLVRAVIFEKGEMFQGKGWEGIDRDIVWPLMGLSSLLRRNGWVINNTNNGKSRCPQTNTTLLSLSNSIYDSSLS